MLIALFAAEAPLNPLTTNHESSLSSAPNCQPISLPLSVNVIKDDEPSAPNVILP